MTKEKLYVLMYNSVGGPYIHTLYALDIPDESTDLPPPATDPFPDFGAADKEPGREPVEAIISFPRERFPGQMGCVKFGSKLYFMGGIIGFYAETAHYTPDVYILDLKNTTTMANLASLPSGRRWEVLEKGPSMSTGKYSPIAFEFGGRIFVLSGHAVCPDTGVDLTPCEVFTPAAGTWEAVDPPPVTGILYNYVTFEGRLIIYNEWGLHYWFNPNVKSGNWQGPIKGIVFDLAESSVFVKDTLYSCCDALDVVALKYSPIKHEESSEVVEGGQREEELFKDKIQGGQGEELLVDQDLVLYEAMIEASRDRLLKNMVEGSQHKLFKDMVGLEVIKNRIMSSRPSSLLVDMGGSKRRFCFLQAASPSVVDPDRRSASDSSVTGYFNLTVFEPESDPKFLYLARYYTKIDQCRFVASYAHIVSP